MLQKLLLDGTEVPANEFYRYAIRWYWSVGNDASLPVLYKDGRRVTKPWGLSMDVSIAGDPGGASANTAD
jgi:hypothetical protein